MNLTLDWNYVFNALTAMFLAYVVKLAGTLALTVKELQAEQKAEREIRHTQIEAMNQRIDDLRANGAALVRH